MTTAYAILVGVGQLYIAPVGTAFPAVNATPGASWVAVGDTRDGVKINFSQSVNKIRHDQRTGPVKATRSEEDVTLETALPEATLENLARVLGVAVTTVEAGVGTIGTKTIGMYRGQTVDEYAILFRGTSAYGSFPAQYQLARGFFDGDAELEHTNEDEVKIPVSFVALEDLNESTEEYRFGRLVHQHEAAE